MTLQDAGEIRLSVPPVSRVWHPIWTDRGAAALLDAIRPSLAVAPSVNVYDRTGALVSTANFSLPGAEYVTTYDFARGMDDAVAICGDSYDSEGRYAPFIAWLSPDRQVSKVIRTYPYLALSIAIAPDGTLWTAGADITRQKGSASPGDYDALRHFSVDGTPAGPGVPWSMVRDTLAVTSGFIVANGDRVGWYSRLHGEGAKYIEVDRLGNVTAYPGFPLPDNSPDRITGIALTPRGEVFVTALVYSKAGPPPVSTTLYLLDRTSKSWLAVDMPPSAAKGNIPLYGSDGESLAFASATTGSSTARLFAVSAPTTGN